MCFQYWTEFIYLRQPCIIHGFFQAKEICFLPLWFRWSMSGTCQDIKRKNRLRSMLSLFLDIAKRIELRSELYYCAFLSAHTQTKGSNDYSNRAQLVHFTYVQNSLNSRWFKTDCLSLFWGVLAFSFCSQNLGKPRITKCRLSLFIFLSSGSLYQFHLEFSFISQHLVMFAISI